MSDPLNNPCSSRTKSCAQEQYGLFRAKPDRGTRGPSPFLGLMPKLPGRSGTTMPPFGAFSVNHQLKSNGATGDENIQSSVDLSRTREEVRHIPVGCGTRFTSTLRSTGVTLNPMCSTSQGHRNADVEDHSSKFLSTSFSSGYLSRSENKISRAGEHTTQSVTSLKDDDKTVTESTCTKYTPELATKILLRYGLEKDDLEQLLSYPEDQITAENLPLVLQQIRTNKEKKTTGKSEHHPEPQFIMGTIGPDKIIRSEGTQMYQDDISSNIKPSGVTGTGLCGTLTAEVVEETGRTICSGGLSLKDTNSSGHSTKLEPKGSAEVKLSGLASLYDQKDCPTRLSSIRNSEVPTKDPTDQLPTQTSQNLQKIFDLFSLPKQDTSMRFSQFFPVKDPNSKCHPSPKTQPSGAVVRGVHPGPRAFVLDGSNICSNDQNKTQQEELKVVEPKKVQDLEQQPKQQFQGERYQTLQQLKQPGLQMGKVSLPQVFSTLKPVSLPSVRPRIVAVPPVPPQPVQSPVIAARMLQKPFSSEAKGSVFKDLPPPAMMEDYAAATPETFPHTCSLCDKQCANINDWIYHQNFRLHLENCKFLRKQYPKWDGQIPPVQSFPDKAAEQLPSPSAQTYQHHDQKSRPESRSRSSSNSPYHHHRRTEARRDQSRSSSRSPSPYCYQTSMGRRRKRRSRSGDSQSSRYTYRSPSPPPWYDRPSSSRYRSRSKSHERRSSPRRSEKKLSSSRKSRRRRPSTDTSSHKRKKLGETRRLTKRLLKTSALQSLLEPPKLKVVVKTLVPVVLAELRKMKSPAASSSSSFPTTKKRSETKLPKAKSVPLKSETSTKPQVGKSPPPTIVKLKGTFDSLSHDDVVAAVELLGKTKFVLLLKSKQQAVVCFDKEEDAEKLKRMKSLDLKGVSVSVVTDQDMVAKKQKKAPQQSSTASTLLTPQTTESSSNIKAVPPTKTLSTLFKVKKTTTSKLILKAKHLVSKAKNNSTQQVVKSPKKADTAGKKDVKRVGAKKGASALSGSKSKCPTERLHAGNSKQKPTTKINTNESLMAPKEPSKSGKPLNTTVDESNKGKQSLTETNWTAQKPSTQMDNLRTEEASSERKVEGIAEKTLKVQNRISESQPDAAGTLEDENLETNVEESPLVSETEMQRQAEVDKVDVQMKEVKLELMMETGASEVDKGQGVTDTGASEVDKGRGVADTGASEVDKGRGVTDTGASEVDEGRGVTDTGASEVDERQGVTDTGASEVDEGQGVTDPGASEVDEGRGVTDPGAPEVDKGQGVTDTGASEVDEGRGVTDTGASEVDEGRGVTDTGASEVDEGQGVTDTGASEVDEGRGVTDTGASEVDEGQRVTETGASEVDEGRGVTDTGASEVDKGQGVTETGASEVDEGRGVTDTGASEVDKGQGVTDTGASEVDKGQGVTDTGASEVDKGQGVTDTGASEVDEGQGVTDTGASSSKARQRCPLTRTDLIFKPTDSPQTQQTTIKTSETVVKTSSQVQENKDLKSAGQLDTKTAGNSTEGDAKRTRTRKKVDGKQRRDPVGPEPKRLCRCSSAAVDPMPSDRRPPVGQEFVVPKWGCFCSLCSVFYLNKDGRKDVHCCSRTHYNNLQKYFQKHKLKLSQDSTQDRLDQNDC